MGMVSSGGQATTPRILSDMVCTACGCLCDDIELGIEGDRIIDARNACRLGRDWFLSDRSVGEPACLVDGQPSTIEEGIDRAARILAGSRYPLIFGLTRTTTEAQRTAVSLAERIGACIDGTSAEGDAATMDALRAVGEVTCTLGEIRNRADLILVWRADPLATHPRLFSRYALDPAGQFIPGGRNDRYCVIVDVEETESVREVADQFIPIREGGEFEAIWTQRALAAGVAIDPEAVESRTGVPLATWQGLLSRMKAARYGAMFYGAGAARTGSGSLVAQGLHSLTRTLNETNRFVCLPLSTGGGNAVGARNVLAWRLGYPDAVSLSRGHPRHGPGEFGARQVLLRREADAALILPGFPLPSLGDEARAYLRRIPRIVLTSAHDPQPDGVAALFRTAAFGIQTTGTAYRMDGVPLPIRMAIPSPYPSDEQVLRAIERRVRSIGDLVPAVAEGA